MWKSFLPYLFDETANHIDLREILSYSAEEKKVAETLQDEDRLELGAINEMILKRIPKIWMKRGDIINISNQEHYNDGCLIWNGSCAENLEFSGDYGYPPASYFINEFGRSDFWDTLSNIENMPVHFKMTKNYQVKEKYEVESDSDDIGTIRLHIVQNSKSDNDIWCFVTPKKTREINKVKRWSIREDEDELLEVFDFERELYSRSSTFQKLPDFLKPLRILLHPSFEF